LLAVTVIQNTQMHCGRMWSSLIVCKWQIEVSLGLEWLKCALFEWSQMV